MKKNITSQSPNIPDSVGPLYYYNNYYCDRYYGSERNGGEKRGLLEESFKLPVYSDLITTHGDNHFKQCFDLVSVNLVIEPFC